MKSSLQFEIIRKDSLKRWQEIYGVNDSLISDNLVSNQNVDGFECRLQRRAKAAGLNHINLFCSLASWGDSLTDLLTDERYDKLYFDRIFGDAKIIARFYTTFFLITSEYLEDFKGILREVFPKNSIKKNRQILSSPNLEFSLDDLLGFINNVVKHKMNIFHACNHHLLPIFSDRSEIPIMENLHEGQVLKIGNIKLFEPPHHIFYPKLSEILESLRFCYFQFDKLMEDDKIFLKVCKKFESQKK